MPATVNILASESEHCTSHWAVMQKTNCCSSQPKISYQCYRKKSWNHISIQLCYFIPAYIWSFQSSYFKCLDHLSRKKHIKSIILNFFSSQPFLYHVPNAHPVLTITVLHFSITGVKNHACLLKWVLKLRKCQLNDQSKNQHAPLNSEQFREMFFSQGFLKILGNWIFYCLLSLHLQDVQCLKKNLTEKEHRSYPCI